MQYKKRDTTARCKSDQQKKNGHLPIFLIVIAACRDLPQKVFVGFHASSRATPPHPASTARHLHRCPAGACTTVIIVSGRPPHGSLAHVLLEKRRKFPGFFHMAALLTAKL
jgi:hypothetical protein